MNASKQSYSKLAIFEEAKDFINQCYRELDKEHAIASRLDEIWHAIGKTGHYYHTEEELIHGARMAWRNSNRCIGRFFWDKLDVFDQRDLSTSEEIFQALCDHIVHATNDGNIRPTISIFRQSLPDQPDIRLWNYQVIRYAGYRKGEAIVGDPDSLSLTAYCESRGWSGRGTQFDVLPVVIQTGDTPPDLFSIDPEIIHEVPISHPSYTWVADLDLRWYAVPIVSDMRLEIGGIHYTAAPFNGWYMGTEIGARNFADADRYNLLPTLGHKLGYDISNDRSLWKDEALQLLNRAVIHSFDKHGVRIVDHHTAATQFAHFERQEAEVDRDVTGEWSWLVPPSAPATTQLFHSSFDTSIVRPNYFYQKPPYETETLTQMVTPPAE